MATKKATSAKKSTTKKTTVQKKPTPTVTTVKAVEPKEPSVVSSAATTRVRRPLRLNFSQAPIVAAFVAEIIGTFLLAGAYIAGQGQPIIVLFAAIAIVLMVGVISGSYLNPALAVGGWVTRRLSGKRTIVYIVGQIIGAILALVILGSFTHGSTAAASASYNTTGSAASSIFSAATLPAGKQWYAFFAELMGSIILGIAFAAGSLRAKDRFAAAYTIGGGLFIGLMLAGSSAALVGATSIINPAVAISLKALSWKLWPIAVYVFSPIVGAVIGFIVYDVLRNQLPVVEE